MPLRLALAAPLAGLVLAVAGGVACADVAYETVLPAVEDETLAEALEGSSNLIALADRLPPTGIGLIRRAAGDVDRLNAALRAFGYYDGSITVTIAGQPLDTPGLAEQILNAAGPVTVSVDIATGPLYRIASIDLVEADASAEPIAQTVDRVGLGLAVGDPARAEGVLQVQRGLEQQMRRQGYPFARVSDRQAVVDHAERTMELTFTLAPGPAARLGPVSFSGLDGVEEDFVRNRIPFDEGDAYAPERLEALRSDLAGLEVFSAVRVDTAEALTPDGLLPLTVTVEERPPRFIGFGADYATAEGFGGRAFWGHRNLFGRGERLRVEGSVARVAENAAEDVDFRLSLTFRKPDLLARDQDLVAGIEYVDEQPDAFARTAITGAVSIERRVTPNLIVSAGVSASVEEITENDVTEDVTLVGLPLSVTFDTADQVLDPTRGMRLNASLTPYPQALGSTENFIVFAGSAATYLDFGTGGNTVLAGRLGLGSIVGAARDDVPASLRFFAGGGGSIRGYGFQRVGPLGADGDPEGGRSLFEFNLELRQRVLEDVGIVPFVDGGNVFESEVPDFDDPLRYAVGIGARYYTDFGPIRADVAFPLNQREGDDDFAVYISLGQAF